MKRMRSGSEPVETLKGIVGMLANGSAGSWEIEIDETLSGTEQWFAQIDGPSIDLYFRIEHPKVVESLLSFLAANGLQTGDVTNKPMREIKVGYFGRTPVSFVWDGETSDRFAILVGGKSGATLRLSVDGNDVADFTNALAQVRDDLLEDGALTQPT